MLGKTLGSFFYKISLKRGFISAMYELQCNRSGSTAATAPRQRLGSAEIAAQRAAPNTIASAKMSQSLILVRQNGSFFLLAQHLNRKGGIAIV